MNPAGRRMNLDARLKLFIALAATFIACLLIGDIIGGKLYQVHIAGWPLTISVGMIPFPIVFLLTDLINEFYGRRATRFVTLVGFGMAWLTILVLFTAVHVPWAPFTRDADWQGVRQQSFDNIFASSQRILIASTVAYLTAQMIDISVFHMLKRLTHNRLLWLRATGSTVVSQLVDTVVIGTLAWYGLLPVRAIVNIMVTSYLVKLVAAIALTPLIYAGHAVVERTLGMESILLGPDGEPIGRGSLKHVS